jgi:hypothetical protein
MVWHGGYLYAGGKLETGAIIAKLDSNLEPIWNYAQT